MFPLIGTLLMSVAGHLLGKAAGKVMDSNSKPDAGQASFSKVLAQENQRLAEPSGATADVPAGGPGLPPTSNGFGGARNLLAAERFEAP